MTHDSDPIHELLELDRYVDGQMSPAERSAFEARLREDADLRHEFELQQRVDSAIRSLRGPIPKGIDIDRVLRRKGVPRFRWHRWAVAAVLALLACAVTYQLWPVSVSERIYAREVSGGMTPTWVCKDDQQLREYTQQTFGTALTLGEVPSSVQVIGWKYTYDPSPTMSILLAKYDGEPVIVLVDLASRMIPIETGVFGKLHVMRRQLGDIAFIEISPRNCLKIAKRFHIASEYDKLHPPEPKRPTIVNSN